MRGKVPASTFSKALIILLEIYQEKTKKAGKVHHLVRYNLIKSR